ncbi:hypothetical protein Patl1_35595 [Pistacia atlantica]|nr:hypothetical protein Patl1_35595 [Pistacia atlantica]
MHNEYGIESNLQHYVCLVYLLGTGGQPDLALKTIQEMPVQYKLKYGLHYLVHAGNIATLSWENLQLES